jgi:hypothetical protein
MLLTISVVLVIALPAGAAKPGKGPKPAIAVSLYANPMSVHEGADIISYTVTLENETRDKITDITVKLSAAGSDDDTDEFSIEAKKDATVNFSRKVSSFPGCQAGKECALLATAEVFRNGVLLTQVTESTPFVPYPACPFGYDGNFKSNTILVSDYCIWTPPKTGVWEITLTPPDGAKRKFTASATVRDHTPGNWCSLTVDGAWGVGGRGADPITGEVYLPGNEDFSEQGLGDGVCLAGGAGGNYFAVGNPDSFYLRTNGDVTVRWLGEDPDYSEWPDTNG